MTPRDAKIPLVIALVAALLLPCAFAGQSATVNFQYISASSDCSAPKAGDVTAGELVYAKIRADNTGDVPLTNMHFFVLDYHEFSGDWNQKINYGTYMYPWLNGLEIPVGGSITFCYPMQTVSTYKAGKWYGAMYFQPPNELNIHPWTLFEYNVVNPGTYEEIEITMSPAPPYTQDVGQQKDITVTVHNMNPSAPFSGQLFLTPWLTFTDGSTMKAVSLPPGGQQSFTTRTAMQTAPYWNVVGVHVNSDSGQHIKRGWYEYIVTGNIYRYWMFQAYANKPIFQPGEAGTISMYVQNIGNVAWESSCCSYRVLLQAKDGTGAYQTLYDQTKPFSTPQAVNEYRWFEESFTNTLPTPMTDYKVCWYLTANGQPGSSYWWDCSIYSPANYPDITSSCTSATEETETDLLLKQNCSAGGNSIVFISEQTEGFSGIQATSGSLTSWAQTSRNGQKGFLVQGSPAATYQLTYKTYKIIEMDAVAPWIFFVLAAAVCAVVALRRPRA